VGGGGCATDLGPAAGPAGSPAQVQAELAAAEAAAGRQYHVTLWHLRESQAARPARPSGGRSDSTTRTPGRRAPMAPVGQVTVGASSPSESFTQPGRIGRAGPPTRRQPALRPPYPLRGQS
jgi:hypothetical protein